MTLQASGSEQSTQSAFRLLHKQVQEQLYRMAWQELRPVQVQAIFALKQKQGDVIISAPTAGGKTEAAFLPILSCILESPLPGLRALYIGPLKALINDQFRRLDELCEHLEIPVHRWHGDVGVAQKRKLLEKPSGILLITPESLESLFVNHADKLSKLYSSLGYIVIDELHSFFGSERGAQLRSLIKRIKRYCGKTPRVIALSATMGDLTLAAKWLCQDDSTKVTVVSDPGAVREIRLGVGAYAEPEHISSREDAKDDEEEVPDERLINDLFKHFHGKKALVFGNQKTRIEVYADAVKGEAARRGVADNFLVHHGSLGKIEREDTEDELRSDRRVAVFCSSTLELGIDIGPVEIVGQLGCPPSVSALLQRVGRSGRREGQPAAIREYCEVRVRKDAPLPDRLHLELLQTCAVSQLAIDGWCEPPRPNKMHLSTLVHQIMALIAEHGGERVPQLYADLVKHGAFPGITEQQFAGLMRSMGKHELIEQDESGLLILGRVGERLARRFDFYSVFQTPTEFDVRHEHRTIGSIQYTPSQEAQQYLILAGKRWLVLSVDQEAQVIQVEPSRGKRAPRFSSKVHWEIDDAVTQMMRTILLSNDPLIFCDSFATKYLDYARREASAAGLSEKFLIPEGKRTYWFSWKGSRINHTLWLIMKGQGLTCHNAGPGLLAIDECDPEKLLQVLRTVKIDSLSLSTVAALQSVVPVEKYDSYLPEELWRYQHSINDLDLEGAARATAELLMSV
jgi:ATP-dependent helicase Lhr and Lhr-like helicase